MAIVSRLGCSSMTTAKGDLLTAPDGTTARQPLRPNLDWLKKDTQRKQEIYRHRIKHCNAGSSSRRLRINKQYEIFVFILQLRRLLETAAWMVGKSLIEVIIDCNAHAGFFFSPLRHQDQAEPLEIRPVIFILLWSNC